MHILSEKIEMQKMEIQKAENEIPGRRNNSGHYWIIRIKMKFYAKSSRGPGLKQALDVLRTRGGGVVEKNPAARARGARSDSLDRAAETGGRRLSQDLAAVPDGTPLESCHLLPGRAAAVLHINESK